MAREEYTTQKDESTGMALYYGLKYRRKRFNELKLWRAMAVGAVVFALIMIGLYLFAPGALAEEMYVICRPDSFANIREKANFRAEIVAMPFPGDPVETDGRKSGQWVHVKYSCEAGEGWIFRGYITDSEPTFYPEGIKGEVNRNRVKARRYVNGPRVRWLKKGTTVSVFAVSDDWCVTSLGYVMTKYLNIEEPKEEEAK